MRLPTREEIQNLHKKIFRGWRIVGNGQVEAVYRKKKNKS